jgi:hypothetical protein
MRVYGFRKQQSVVRSVICRAVERIVYVRYVKTLTMRTSQTGCVFIQVFWRTCFDHLTFRFVKIAP